MSSPDRSQSPQKSSDYFDSSAGSGLSGSFDDTPPPQTPAAASVRPRSPARSMSPVDNAREAAGSPRRTNILGPSLRMPSSSYAQHPGFEQPLRREERSDQEEETTDIVDKSVHGLFSKEYDRYEALWNTNDIPLMRNFLKNNYYKLIWYNYIYERIKKIVEEFASEEHLEMVIERNYSFDVMINVIKHALDQYKRKLAVMDISYEFPDTSEGLSTAIKTTRKKITDVLYDLQKTIINQENEIACLKEDVLHMSEVQAELEAAKNHIRYLNERDKYAIVDPGSEIEFICDLEYRLTMQEHLGSSLSEELEKERKSKQEIYEQYLQVEMKRARDQQQLLVQIEEASKHLDMQELIRDGITAKIKSLTANHTEVSKAVDEWLRTIQEVIEKNRNVISAKTEEFRQLGYNLSLLETYHNEREKEIIEVQKAIDETKSILSELKETLKERQKEVTDVKALHEEVDKKMKLVTQLQKEEKSMSGEIERAKGAIELSKDEIERSKDTVERLKEQVAYQKSLEEQMRKKVPRYRDVVSKLAGQQIEKVGEHLLESVAEQGEPETVAGVADYKQMLRKRGTSVRSLTPKQYGRLTPEMKERLPVGTLTSTPETEQSPILGETASPFVSKRLTPEMERSLTPEMKEVLRTSFSSPEYKEQLDDDFLIIPTPQPPRSPSPSPPRDIPLITLTPPPAAEPSVRIGETASSFVTPPSPRTPFISKSRFGFTDPTVPARELNIPPGPFEIATPFRKTIVLTSPKRVEPLLVNIGVDPKPLTDTENGEYFVCDISLDVQTEGHGLIAQLPQASGGVLDRTSPSIHERTFEMSESPVIKRRRRGRYNVPPDITPTSTRIHGPRRIPGRRPISELPWSPTYLPEDARSPVSSFPPSPYESDRSVSWERSNESYYGSATSPSPVIKGKTYGRRSPDWDHRSESYYASSPTPSPVIKGPTYGQRSPDWDRRSESYYATSPTPSPVIKGPTYGHRSPDWDRRSESYYATSPTPSPVIKGPTYGYRSPDWDRRSESYYATSPTPSPVIKGPTYGHRSPEIEMSESPVIKGRRRGRYNVPSDITPTSRRRHLPRQIPGRHPLSELPWSPTYLQEDVRSPLSPFPPSPYWADKSVSWEHSDEKYYGSSPSPVIKRPTYGYGSPDWDRRSESYYASSPTPSPVIKGPTYGHRSPDWDRRSPSPVIIGPSFSDQSPYSDLSSTSPVIKGPSFRDQSPYSDHSSPSPMSGTHRVQLSPEKTYGSDSLESEGGYLEGSLNDSSLVDEAGFFQ